MHGEIALDNGGVAVPAFVLISETYMQSLSPGPSRPRLVSRPQGYGNLLRIWLRLPFSREIVIDQPWTDWKGEKHEKMIGRPVAMHAMRGISAHSNGFQTCRALHLLQLC